MNGRRLRTLALCFLPLTVALVSGCGIGANDDPFNVTIMNDTASTIVDHTFFDAARGDQHVSGNDQTIAAGPGASFGVTEFANLGTDPDRITTFSGRTLGCLPFQFSEDPPVQPVVKVTQMVPCRHWGNEVESPRDWPDPNY
jgi:hypothetical protein